MKRNRAIKRGVWTGCGCLIVLLLVACLVGAAAFAALTGATRGSHPPVTPPAAITLHARAAAPAPFAPTAPEPVRFGAP
jgi:hypothetical protein